MYSNQSQNEAMIQDAMKDAKKPVAPGINVTLHKAVDQDKIMNEVFAKVNKIKHELEEKVRQQNSKIGLISTQVDTLNKQMIETILKQGQSTEPVAKSETAIDQELPSNSGSQIMD
jgi:hypothetical protein